MMAKDKALYQVKVILDYLPRDEYALISPETIEYIDENYEFDENFSLDPNVPLYEQKISSKAYNVLKKVVKEIETNAENYKDMQLDNMSNEDAQKNLRIAKSENVKLKQMVGLLKANSDKVDDAEKLVIDYRQALSNKDAEISKLKEQLSLTQKDNENLIEMLNKVPRFFRKFFIGKECKLLK